MLAITAVESAAVHPGARSITRSLLCAHCGCATHDRSVCHHDSGLGLHGDRNNLSARIDVMVSSVGSTGEPLADRLDNLARRWHHAKQDEWSAVEHRFTVHDDRILAVVSVDRIHLDPKLSTQPRRHTDGVKARDSERTVANRDSGHEHAYLRLESDHSRDAWRSCSNRFQCRSTADLPALVMLTRVLGIFPTNSFSMATSSAVSSFER